MSEPKEHYSIMGRESSLSPALVAVSTAVGVGINGMLSNGLTTGSAIGTAVGAVAAYAITDITKTSVAGASIIGGLAGSAGLAIGAKIDNPSQPVLESGLNALTGPYSMAAGFVKGL